MLTRRELVTGTAIGAIATVASNTNTSATSASPEAPVSHDARAVTPQPESDSVLLKRIADKSTEIDQTLDGISGAVRSNSLAFGFVPKLREAYTLYWKTHGKFPEFCEVGTAVFYDIYDWHIKNRQPIPVSRFADGRMSITFMYTTLLVRIEHLPDYIGLPFDRQ